MMQAYTTPAYVMDGTLFDLFVTYKGSRKELRPLLLGKSYTECQDLADKEWKAGKKLGFCHTCGSNVEPWYSSRYVIKRSRFRRR